MKGVFVSFAGRTLTLRDEAGAARYFSVSLSAVVTINGKRATMADLRPGDEVALLGTPAATVAAIRS